MTVLVDRRRITSIGIGRSRTGITIFAGIALGALWLLLSLAAAFAGGSLTVSAGAHIDGSVLAWAALATLLTLRGPDAVTGGEFGIEGSVIVTLTTLAAVAFLLALWRRTSARERT